MAQALKRSNNSTKEFERRVRAMLNHAEHCVRISKVNPAVKCERGVAEYLEQLIRQWVSEQHFKPTYRRNTHRVWMELKKRLRGLK